MKILKIENIQKYLQEKYRINPKGKKYQAQNGKPRFPFPPDGDGCA